MSSSKYKLTRIAILGIILIALLVLAAFQAGGGNIGLAAGASPNSPAAISAGQQAAIDGAVQLLLFQPQSQTVYVPLVLH